MGCVQGLRRVRHSSELSIGLLIITRRTWNLETVNHTTLKVDHDQRVLGGQFGNRHDNPIIEIEERIALTRQLEREARGLDVVGAVGVVDEVVGEGDVELQWHEFDGAGVTTPPPIVVLVVLLLLEEQHQHVEDAGGHFMGAVEFC